MGDGTNQDILNGITLQRIEKALGDFRDETRREIAALKDAIGWERTDEKGEPIGTGLTGRVMRQENALKAKVTAFDGMRKYATGATAGMGLMIIAIWWLIADKVQGLLK
ncbi:MAG: hypothetical protein J7521_20345 [Caulobacter sp.]|nr:hypothetical protein [Caulobacter sp.]